MKKTNLFLIIIPVTIMIGCGGNKQSESDLIKVDVTASYPKKELILQDFADVEYIPLETTDSFITQGFVRDIGEKILLVTNRKNDGDIFIYDRTGKALRKINRKGQGGEEYLQTTQVILDETNSEMFVVAYSARKISVYDLYGNFKRSFNNTDSCYYTYVYNYDRENLICYKNYSSSNKGRPCFLIISKRDGSITREINIPFKEIKTQVITKEINGKIATVSPLFNQIIPYKNQYILMEASSDTVYNYLPDGTISPFIVRTPSVNSMDPEVLLDLSVLTDRYYFMQTLKKEFDFQAMNGFPTIDLVYDKQNNAVFKYTVYNDDYSNKKQVDLSSPSLNQEIASCQSLESDKLVEDYKNGELKGKLKEIASKLKEDDNPVIMLIKQKK